MFVWRDKAGRIESVSGSIHQPTLDWLLAEDEWRQESGGKAETAPAKTPPRPATKAPQNKATSGSDS